MEKKSSERLCDGDMVAALFLRLLTLEKWRCERSDKLFVVGCWMLVLCKRTKMELGRSLTDELISPSRALDRYYHSKAFREQQQ